MNLGVVYLARTYQWVILMQPLVHIEFFEAYQISCFSYCDYAIIFFKNSLTLLK